MPVASLILWLQKWFSESQGIDRHWIKKIKAFTELQAPAKYIVKRNESGEVLHGFKSGNNAFGIVYKNSKNKYEIRIVSTDDAYQARKANPDQYINRLVHDRQSSDSKPQYVLFQGDIIQIDNPDKTSKFKKVNLLVKKLTSRSDGRFAIIVSGELNPLLIQKDYYGWKEKKNKKGEIIGLEALVKELSPKFFQDHQPIKLNLSPIGA